VRATTFTLQTSDGVALFVYRWLPEEPVKAVVQIAHGWAEHAGRYARVAEALCREGYAVYADDHRGHGVRQGLLPNSASLPSATAGTNASMIFGGSISTSAQTIPGRQS
jgi:alpha-beta hydrolase superfamily lysophospholipase